LLLRIDYLQHLEVG